MDLTITAPTILLQSDPKKQFRELRFSNFFPANQHIATMTVGAFTYHDWDELVLTEVPIELNGQKLLTTIRGRAREAHLVNAFRKTPFLLHQNLTRLC